MTKGLYLAEIGLVSAFLCYENNNSRRKLVKESQKVPAVADNGGPRMGNQ